MPHPVLILFAHPALEKSRVNQRLLGAARGLDGVTVHDLYEEYPDFHVDVPREQQLLVEHDVIVLHHPFYWYSAPPLVKQWEDLVLEHGWAYGSRGTALAGKRFLSAITTGGRRAAYERGGYNRYTIAELLAPIEQTARLCRMEPLPPFIAYGSHQMGPDEIARHADEYRRVLIALRDDALDPDALARHHRINEDLDAVIRTGADAR